MTKGEKHSFTLLRIWQILSWPREVNTSSSRVFVEMRWTTYPQLVQVLRLVITHTHTHTHTHPHPPPKRTKRGLSLTFWDILKKSSKPVSKWLERTRNVTAFGFYWVNGWGYRCGFQGMGQGLYSWNLAAWKKGASVLSYQLAQM